MPRPRHPVADKNQREIERNLINLGFIVRNVSSLPVSRAGCDLYVFGYSRITHRVEILAVEVKTPDGQPTASEREFSQAVAALASDGKTPLVYATCAEDVLRWFGAI